MRIALDKRTITWHIVRVLHRAGVLMYMLIITSTYNFIPLEASSYILTITMTLRGSSGTTPIMRGELDVQRH